MASISYWFLSPSVLLATLGKLKGFDRTRPTPAFDWSQAVVDVAVPARNEEANIGLCLASIYQQDFPIRKVTVIDDASSDRTAEVVKRYSELSGHQVELVARPKGAGKTPTLREQCETSDADALVIVDADTVLADRNYISRCVQELFRNAGVASACGEVRPLTLGRRRRMADAHPVARTIRSEFGAGPKAASRWEAFLEALTVIYRGGLYLFLQRFVYDGHLKLFGSRLNPIGCAVAYRTARLRDCFRYAQPRMGDNLSHSEDIFIGHYFNWKGWRNVQVSGVRCDSIEPTLDRLPHQLFHWSSSFLQTLYYFKDLPLSPIRKVKQGVLGLFGPGARKQQNRRQIQEQYRAPWGEPHTHRFGRGIGLVDVVSLFEKTSYPLVLIYLAIFHPQIALLTIGLEMLLLTVSVFVLADAGTRLQSAAMMVAATPVRLFSLAVDLVAVLRYLADLATGNREWRK
jgi:glycosyltransferase involved in cell wall biosynthesis